MRYTHKMVLSLLSLLTQVSLCSGAERTFFFSGEVSQVPTELEAFFSDGDPLSGSYTFETTADDSTPGNMNVGTYISSVSSFAMTIGTYSLISDGLGDIEVVNDVGGEDSYTVVSFADGALLGGLSPFLMALQLSDTTGTALSSEALPTDPPQPSLFTEPDVTIDFAGATSVRLFGTLELLVPEPVTSYFAWLGGLAVFCQTGRRRMHDDLDCMRVIHP